MDIPLTVCTVITIQYSDGAVPAYVDAQEVFIFFGVPTTADYNMVDEYIAERADYYGADEAAVAAELEAISFGNNKFIPLPEGNMTSHWEQRL